MYELVHQAKAQKAEEHAMKQQAKAEIEDTEMVVQNIAMASQKDKQRAKPATPTRGPEKKNPISAKDIRQGLMEEAETAGREPSRMSGPARVLV